MVRLITASTLLPPALGGCHAVLHGPATKRLIVAAQRGERRDGSWPDDFVGQLAQAFDNLLTVVQAAQMGPEDIVRLDVSMLAPGVPADIVERLRAERLGRFPCAMACTAVAGLGDVRCLVQIGAEAMRGA
jgi:enamine deaminase RidA (YjgF/YER057c/UK114 family)